MCNFATGAYMLRGEEIGGDLFRLLTEQFSTGATSLNVALVSSLSC